MNNVQQSEALVAQEIFFMELDTELAAQTTVKSLSFTRHPDFPDMLILTKIRIAIPAQRIVLDEHTRKDIVCFPVTETRTPISTTEGIPTFVQAMPDGTLEIESEYPGGGKIPNTPGQAFMKLEVKIA